MSNLVKPAAIDAPVAITSYERVASSITRLKQALERVRDLGDKVAGTEAPCDPNAIEYCNLKEMLDCAPNHIASLAEDIISVVNAIDDTLFE